MLYGQLYTHYTIAITSPHSHVDIRPGSVLSKGREVLVPSSGESADDIARASALLKGDVVICGDLNVLTPDRTVDPVFLALSLTYSPTRAELAARAQGKSVVHLHNSELRQARLMTGQQSEQKRIADHFMRFENLITLHQREPNNTKGSNYGS